VSIVGTLLFFHLIAALVWPKEAMGLGIHVPATI